MTPLERFGDRGMVRGLAQRIASHLKGRGKPLALMEVCGTHTMAIQRYGLRSLLPPGVRLISGPGCPVCVTPNRYLDHAVALSRLPDLVIATFGDLLRVPGSSSSLMEERARGGEVRVVYSPLEALRIAAEHPGKRVVFLGVGFETTAPAVACSILEARAQGIGNFFVLASHKSMPQPMAALSADPELSLDGYLCPPHVSAVIGAAAYRSLCRDYRIPCVVAGFEPVDIMQGVEMLVRQALSNESRVEIQYSRVVRWGGNARAQAIVKEVFHPCDAEWRGIGIIPGSGLGIAERYRAYDARRCIEVDVEEPSEHEGCLCGEVLKGKLSPADCPLFGRECTPESPAGACMVSSEGSCAAAYGYGTWEITAHARSVHWTTT